MRWIGVALAALGVAACDGEPLGDRVIQVELGYRDQTNFGPETATGTAIIDTPSGRVDLEVRDMALLMGDRYQLWLAGGGEELTAVVTFDVGAGGGAMVAAELGDLRERTFEEMFVTVEPDPDPSSDPDPRRSIGGTIPFAF
jgi:hypothetical protein